MLTGVELAGLVLGSIPLLISAAEHRDVSLTPINVLLFGKKQAQKLSEVLEERRIGFRHCCEQMLSIAEIDFPAKYLLDTKGKAQLHQLWSDTNLAARLKSEFGDDFRIIELRLGEILASIQKLEKYIGKYPKEIHRAAHRLSDSLSRIKSAQTSFLGQKSSQRCRRASEANQSSTEVPRWRGEKRRHREHRQLLEF
jgi:hypothetical protein